MTIWGIQAHQRLLRIDNHRKELYSSTPAIFVTIKENNIQTGKIEHICLRGKLMSKKGKRVRQHRAALKFSSPGPDVIGIEFFVFSFMIILLHLFQQLALLLWTWPKNAFDWSNIFFWSLTHLDFSLLYKSNSLQTYTMHVCSLIHVFVHLLSVRCCGF